MRRFYLHKRNGIFYVELIEPTTRARLSARSTGKTNRDEAVLVVSEWLRDGIPDAGRSLADMFTAAAAVEIVRRAPLEPQDVEKILSILKERGFVSSGAVLRDSPAAHPAVDYMADFWDAEKSVYLKDQAASGRNLTKRHIQLSNGVIKKYWMPYFKDKPLGAISRDDLKAFKAHLAKIKPPLAAASLNRILRAGKTPFKFAAAEGIIPVDPSRQITTFSGKARKRGVLSIEEAQAVFSVQWRNPLTKVGNMLAATTGLRAGEIIALKAENIDGDFLNITHSYSEIDGLKPPKNGESRRVPILPEVRDELKKLAEASPEGYLFPGTAPERPLNQRELLYDLLDALVTVTAGPNPTPKERAAAWALSQDDRKICFHSWRHFFASRMASVIDLKRVMTATGHKSMAVAQVYADHASAEDLAAVRGAAESTLGKILSFNQKLG